MRRLIQNFLKKTTLRTKFRLVILLIFLLGLANFIGFMGLQKTNDFLQLERDCVVSTLNLKLKLNDYVKNPEQKKILAHFKSTLINQWQKSYIPKLERTVNTPITGPLEAFIFKNIFDDEVNKSRKIVESEEKIVSRLIKTIDGYLNNSYTLNEFTVQTNAALDRLSMLSNELMNLSTSVSSGVYHTLLIVIMILLTFTIVFTFALLIYVRKSILRFVDTIQDIAKGDGDLTVEMPTDSADTFGMLSSSFNLFISQIRNLVVQLKEGISHVEESSQGISSFTEESTKDIDDIMKKVNEINKNADAQKDNVLNTIEMIHEVFNLMKKMADDIEKETVTIAKTGYTMKYMARQFKLIAENSQNVDNSANKLLKVAREGTETVNKTLESIKEIQEDSSKIEDIVYVISNIAEQTNLLAMNAAIEAAHAGDYGKGFAVVADEVRKLAENSSAASKEIIILIKNTVQKIEVSAELSTHSYEALKIILDDAELTARFVSEVTSGMNEMLEEANEILEDIEEVNRITANVKEGAERSREKGQTVLTAVHEVKEYAVNITESLRSQVEHSESIAANVESLSDFAHLNGKFVEHLISLSERFKTDKTSTAKADIVKIN